jgi:capsular exopolysaccharide synthesis family protein
MSKLETAFSKALKQRADIEGQNAAQANSSDSITKFDAGFPVAPVTTTLAEENATEIKRSGLSKLATVKEQIRNMVHTNLFTDDELAKRRIVYPRMKDKNLLNIYRNLRTKLLSKANNKNFITLVTSVVPGGGSSLISANIAATFAFDEGKTALLIEGNVHQPSLGRLFDLKQNELGLMDYIESESMKIPDILYESGIPRLRFIPAGRCQENSAEYFTSKKMRQVMDEITKKYPERYPIIDASSLSESADTRILIELCDQVILVVPYGLCSEDDIKASVEAIGKAKLAGVVLNQF